MAENENNQNINDFGIEGGDAEAMDYAVVQMCGGYSEENEITENLKTLVLSLLPKIESLAGRNFETFEPVSFTSQVVCGTNYDVKAHIGNGEHIRVRIFEPLECYKAQGEETEVTGVS
jgi:hypothetical protein